MSHKPMIYSHIHKGIRSRLFQISTKAARLDFGDKESVQKFQEEFAALMNNIHHHHNLEEKFIHPLLNDRVPGGADELEEEHRVVLHLINNLVKNLDGIIAKPVDSEKRREQGLEFYLAYNRFMVYFMDHLNDEEQNVQRYLWDLCSVQEVAKAVGELMASQEPALAMENFGMIVAWANLDEITDLVIEAKATVPEPVFQAGMSLAQSALSAREYAVLRSRVGVK
jgi:hemerythrin